MDTVSGQIDLSKLAPPGISGALKIEAEFDSDHSKPTDDVTRLTDTKERDFAVTCQFAKETGFSSAITGVVDPTLGTSFFKPQPGISDYRVRTPAGTYTLIINADGEFSGARLQCRATSLEQAKQIFLKGIVPFLDHLAYIANAPLILSRVLYMDEKNAIQSFAFMTPYQDALVNPFENNLNDAMLPVYALYREAKNTMSPLYRFLCYYKILEGIYNSLRPELYRLAKEKNITLNRPREIIPDDPELRTTHPSLIGRPIKELFDRELTTDYRNDVAHYVLDTGAFLSVTDPTVTDKYLDILWPVEICCRTVIPNQEQYYIQYQQGLTK